MSDAIRALVAQLIEDAGIVFAVHYTGTKEHEGRPMDAWRVTLSRPQVGTKRPAVLHATAHYTGLGLRQHGIHASSPPHPKEPSAADVLHCLLYGASLYWDVFCQDTGEALRGVFDPLTLRALRDALKDY